jgi:hypothetical protein
VLELRERDRLESLFLEVLEDQSKRELLLYLLCYIQLVKKEGNFSIGLDQFLGCAYRSFRASRSQWKDVLVELNLLKITDIYGNVYAGKDIYKLQEDNLLFVSLYEQYLEIFTGLSNKVVKYWSIAHRLSYSKLWNPQDAIIWVFISSTKSSMRSICTTQSCRKKGSEGMQSSLRFLKRRLKGQPSKIVSNTGGRP